MNNISLFRKPIHALEQILHLSVVTCVLCGGRSENICCADCQQDFDAISTAITSPHPAIDQVLAAYRFAYPLNHVIHALKYGGTLALAPWLAALLVPRMLLLQENPVDLVVGMPLHSQRIALRGFNQSHEIARYLARRLGVPCKTEVCTRVFHLPPQVELTGLARRGLPNNLFECRADLDGLHVLLVDDVITTGASLTRLAQCMRLHGARRVSAAVVASAI